jgi:hypothetical protein
MALRFSFPQRQRTHIVGEAPTAKQVLRAAKTDGVTAHRFGVVLKNCSCFSGGEHRSLFD